jgi:hypothetical protein
VLRRCCIKPFWAEKKWLKSTETVFRTVRDEMFFKGLGGKKFTGHVVSYRWIP